MLYSQVELYSLSDIELKMIHWELLLARSHFNVCHVPGSISWQPFKTPFKWTRANTTKRDISKWVWSKEYILKNIDVIVSVCKMCHLYSCHVIHLILVVYRCSWINNIYWYIIICIYHSLKFNLICH